MRLEHLLSGEAALSLPFEDRDEVVAEDRVEKSSVAFLLLYCLSVFGGLAQLARALAWHARGHRFDSDILHHPLSWRKRSLTY